jgi:hypothetical protein
LFVKYGPTNQPEHPITTEQLKAKKKEHPKAEERIEEKKLSSRARKKA